MAIPRISHRIVYTADPELQGRALSRIVRQALQKAAEDYVLKIMLPKKFTPTGAREYNYKARTKKYMIRKAKVKRHQNPFEWSGATKRLALNSAKAKATKKSIRVKFDVPRETQRFLFFRGYNIKAELSAVSRADLLAINEIVQNEIEEGLNKRVTGRRTERVA